MKKLIWMIFLFGVYLWAMTSGRDRWILEKGKSAYEALVAWLDDAEIDFQAKEKLPKAKKRSRRWD